MPCYFVIFIFLIILAMKDLNFATVFDLYVHFAPEDNIYCGMLKNSDLPLAGQIWEND